MRRTPRSDLRRPGADVAALPPNFNLLSTDAVLTGRIHSQFLIHFCICSVMVSFKEFRETLLLYYDVDLITDEHALWPFLSSKNCFKKAEAVFKLN